MGLKKAVHYGQLVELTDYFRVFNPRFNGLSIFSLEHVALALLGVDLSGRGYHDPRDDAAASMELYRRYIEYHDGSTALELSGACAHLLAVPTRPSFAKRCNWTLHGVCMAAHTPSKCTCSDPPFDRSNRDE
eukprot:comp22241_c0_seq2/m.32817 comp22241_c0_seq2/g.32817  ORF comp22241_c0_seq2/g.32817 comp22241_c0_seq2/m.32817 type:complete len:132 (-) comp22241_c0_seq2:596-991(-)